MKQKEMNRIERIADAVGWIALSAAICLSFMVFMQRRLYLFPAAAAAFILFFAANAVAVWRRKRGLAVVNILGAVAVVIVTLFGFF